MTADIVIEVNTPHVKDYSDNNGCEPFADVLQRIENIATDTADTIDPTANEILETAISKLSFNMSDVASVKNVALTIARLDHANNVKAEHIAEAIQYKILNR